MQFLMEVLKVIEYVVTMNCNYRLKRQRHVPYLKATKKDFIINVIKNV